MRIFRFAIMTLTAALAAAAITGCSREEPAEDYGYVQFKLYKEASYASSKAAQIDYLADITKARITMDYQGTLLNQTLVFSSSDRNSAEYGIRSEKLQLLAGDYEVVSFTVLDKMDNEGKTVSVTGGHKFSVQAGGMVVHDLTVGTDVVPSRGNVKFTFVKDMSDLEVPDTKALADKTFDEAKYITLSVVRKANNQTYTFSQLPVEFSIHFNDDGNDMNVYPDGYDKYEDFGYQTSSLQTDTLLCLLAGEYRVSSYVLLDKSKITFENGTFDNASVPTFRIDDNKSQNVYVPVALAGDAPYLQDYYALYEIWKSLDGPNWHYRGENYADGTNWDFNKDPDLWGDQPGVRIHENGRVASLDLTDFGIKGDLSPAIGQLTELVQLYLSTHNDINNFVTTDPAEMSRTRLERNKKYLAELNPLTQLSEPIAFGCAEKKIALPETALYEKGYSEKQIYAMEGFTPKAVFTSSENKRIRPKDAATGTITSELSSIPDEIENLTKLEYLYIANCKIKSLPAADKMAKLASLTDFELYNCPELEMNDQTVASLGALPSLISINLGNNTHWTPEQCDRLMKALSEGPSADKIQIFYFRNNQLDALKSEYFSKFKKIGLLDLVNNRIREVGRLGADISPVQFFLDYNEIESIPNNEGGEMFCNMDDVEAFSVTHNRLTEFPDIFDAKSIFTVKSVDFSYNEIDRIANGDSFKGINCGTLSLASNKFTKYPLEFTHSNSMVQIYNFRGNGMREIDRDAFDSNLPHRENLRYTQTFDFTYNRLSDLPVTFADAPFPFLYSIDISYNAFKEFPREPLNYLSIVAYAIRGQRDDNGKRILRDWPTGLYNHRGLRGLYIGSNDYRRIDDTISQLIYYFDISDNPDIEFDASDICLAWRAGAYRLIYDQSQNILNCPQMLE